MESTVGTSGGERESGDSWTRSGRQNRPVGSRARKLGRKDRGRSIEPAGRAESGAQGPPLLPGRPSRSANSLARRSSHFLCLLMLRRVIAFLRTPFPSVRISCALFPMNSRHDGSFPGSTFLDKSRSSSRGSRCNSQYLMLFLLQMYLSGPLNVTESEFCNISYLTH